MINLKDIILDKKWKSLLFIFFNTKEIDFESNKIIINISYKESKFSKIKISNDLLEENNLLISNFFELPFILKNKNHYFEIFFDDFSNSLERKK